MCLAAVRDQLVPTRTARNLPEVQITPLLPNQRILGGGGCIKDRSVRKAAAFKHF